MKFSIIIPAHNEEKYLLHCLDSIKKASESFPSQVEVIVVVNRCIDSTESIAKSRGVKVIHNNSRNLAKIRNAGVQAAIGDILVTIDADSIMSENMLIKIAKALETGKYIGGGVPILPERSSLAINLSLYFIQLILLCTGLSGGLFWCYLKDFKAIGGFNENLLLGEDLEFARRLKIYGKKIGKDFISLKGTHIITSCRKFDHFGEWIFFKSIIFHSRELREGLKGIHNKIIDEFFYDFKK